MCFYITATLPKGTHVDNFRNILEQHKMAFTPITNSKVQSQLRPNELYFRATKNYCDCDTVLGSLNNLHEYNKISNSKKVKTLKKKSWSDVEINKWIDNKLRNRQKKSVKKFSPIERRNETERWMKFLHDLLDNKIVSRIGLLKHWYEKGLEDEQFELLETQKKIINDLTPDLLLNMSEDTLYEFIPDYSY